MTANAPAARSAQRALATARELAIAGAAFLLYRQARVLTADHVDTARRHAHALLEIERRLVGLPERAVQQLVIRSDVVVELLNRYYVSVHFPLTIAFVVWLLVRHPDAYRPMRNWLMGVTGAALVVHVAYPLAPPRMMPGFVDTLRVYGPNIYPADPARSVANQFAAMPSLHFGWSLIVAIGIVLTVRRRSSLVALAHPVLTLTAIVGTGNHYLIDAAVAGLIVLAVGLVVPGALRRRAAAHAAR